MKIQEETLDTMLHEIIMAGTGGQGIMIIGQLLAHAAVIEDKNVVWFPSYGPETRGGTSNCTVIVSNQQIGSPVTPSPDTLLAMSQQALDRYFDNVQREGVMVINSTLVTVPEGREDCKIVALPASATASELGDIRVANMIMLGAFTKYLRIVSIDSLCEALKLVLPARKHHLIPLNEIALRKGADLV